MPYTALAQIDPDLRQSIQIGYNQPLEGRSPLAFYAFYYRNQPGWWHTNLTLRTVIAPTYLDSELGIKNVFGDKTDLAIGLSGGGFADGYAEIRRGNWERSESFVGHGGDLSVSLYHRFNPVPDGRKPEKLSEVPLVAVVRTGARFSAFDTDDGTSPNFKLPDDKTEFYVRTGMRWGGREPELFPDTAVELSIWYEGHFRTESQLYGFNDDREIKGDSHRFWARALTAYTFPESRHRFEVSLTAGTSAGTDRLTAYRLGGALPLAAEFPLMLPGYYNQELSAQKLLLASGSYTIPLGDHWEIVTHGSTAVVDFLPGFDTGSHWQSGVGADIGYHTGRWHVLAGYGYGFNAVRGDRTGAQTLSFLMQYDFEAASGGEHSKSFIDRLNQGILNGLDKALGR
ncbi:MAG TPA: hypothetical protein VMF06_22005 [Candidatus Limnocylindria bacterium]|nr:hypothetical protein [Candidatus Limnocylindria bacterium]